MKRIFLLSMVCGIVSIFVYTQNTQQDFADPDIQTSASIARSIETQDVASTTTQQTVPPTPNETPVRVPILVYHGVRDTTADEPADVREYNIAPSMLEKQLQYLGDHNFTTITFHDLDRYFDENIPLPDKPVILSFDDGWRSQHENALPLLKKYNMQATFFFFPNGLGHENFMSWDEVREIVDAGMEIGSHSKSHLYMTKQDVADLPKETAYSKKWLEEELQVPVTAIAYPFGLYNDAVIEAVQNAGYTEARTLDKTTIQYRAQRLTLGSYLARNNFEDFVFIVDTVEVNAL